ncbi:MAG: hypothetical protein D6734_04060 [Candidatus Schekmanbacteria bacterium]|nr:MAG: hypothetical protein D6734_04060 [Candidatus Schekmanbacteria bacterium]
MKNKNFVIPLIFLFFFFISVFPLSSYGKGVLTYITVVSISAEDEGSNDETNVDIFRTLDCDGDDTTVDPEPFSDLKATITLDNSGHPNYEDDPVWDPTNHDVVLTSYKVKFRRTSKRFPRIKSFTRNIAATLPKDKETDITITVLPKSYKRKLARKYILKFGEDPSDNSVEPRFLDYNVKIKIKGHEKTFGGNKVKAKTGLTMTLTQVDNCE